MIHFKSLRKCYGKNLVLNSIDLTFPEKGITAILGPNGSGKTTLIKCFLGLVIPDSGEITYNDQPVKGQFQYRDSICHLPQIAQFPNNLDVEDILNMIKDLRPNSVRDDELIELFELQPHLGKKVNALSGGTKQKVNLLLALMYDNPLLILDEPATGLDPLALVRLKDLLKEERSKGKQILITTHSMNFVQEMADHIIFLLDGKIFFDGSLDDLLHAQQEKDLEHAIAKIFSPKTTT